MHKMKSSDYIESTSKVFSIYTLANRALPHVTDGLKPASRRVLWTARDGKKWKSASLAGATMPIHPHASPEGSVNTLAAPYGNNAPLLTGEGAFGTLLTPHVFGASRYTSVKLSEFTKDVVFRDIEIVPMVDNYDSTTQEPMYFLPLVPIVLLNPQEGIAVGYSTKILPRSLVDIINSQLRYLSNKTVDDVLPSFAPTEAVSSGSIQDKNGNTKWLFTGGYTKTGSKVIVNRLPYGMSHEKYMDKIAKLEDSGIIKEVNDNSKNYIKIELTFKRGVLSKLDHGAMIKMLGLDVSIADNMNIIDFTGDSVWQADYVSVIKKFTDWRLWFYEQRYLRLVDILQKDIQKMQDVITAVDKNVGGIAKKISSKDELVDYLEAIGIVYVDYIASLPVYRFVAEEKEKVQVKLTEALKTLAYYNDLLTHPSKRKDVYVTELKEVLTKHKKGKYVD